MDYLAISLSTIGGYFIGGDIGAGVGLLVSAAVALFIEFRKD